MSQNFTNFTERTTSAELSGVQIVGYSPAANVEFRADLLNVVNHLSTPDGSSSQMVMIGDGNTGSFNSGYSGNLVTAIGISNNSISNFGYGTGSSAAIGNANTANGYTNAVAVGAGNSATVDHSTALGINNTAHGYNTVAIGYNNSVNTNLRYFSTAVGSNNILAGNHGAIFGYNNRSTADDTGTIIVGNSNVPIGPGNCIFGNSTHAQQAGFVNAFVVGNSNYAIVNQGGVVVGNSNTLNGTNCLILGNSNVVDPDGNGTNNLIAIGIGCSVGYGNSEDTNSTAIGRSVHSTKGALELGDWSTTRAAVRMHTASGMTNLTVPQTDTAFTDGGSTAGSEVDGTLMRGSIAVRISTSNHAILQFNNASGNVTSLDLGLLV